MVPGQVGLGSEQSLPPGPGREPGQGSRCAPRTGKGLASKSQAEGWGALAGMALPGHVRSLLMCTLRVPSAYPVRCLLPSLPVPTVLLPAQPALSLCVQM